MPMGIGCGSLDMSDPKLVNQTRELLGRVLTAIEELDAYELMPPRESFPAAGWSFTTLSQWVGIPGVPEGSRAGPPAPKALWMNGCSGHTGGSFDCLLPARDGRSPKHRRPMPPVSGVPGLPAPTDAVLRDILDRHVRGRNRHAVPPCPWPGSHTYEENDVSRLM